MSQDNPTTPPDAPKRKKGFWSWLTGEREEDGNAAPSTGTTPEGAAPAAAATPPGDGATFSDDATPPALPGEAASSGTAAVPAPELVGGATSTEAPGPAGDKATPGVAAPALSGDVVTAQPLGGVGPSGAAESNATAPAPLGDAAPSATAVTPAPVAQPVHEADAVSPVPAPAVPGAGTQGSPSDLDASAPFAAGAEPIASAPDTPAAEAPVPAPDVLPAHGAAAPSSSEPPLVAGAPADSPTTPETQSAAPVAVPEEAAAAEPARKGFWGRLVSGLARTAGNLGQGITDLVSKRKLDADTLEELEDVLIRADLGTDTAARIVAAVGKGRHDKMISPEEVKGLIAQEVETILAPVARPLVVDASHKPFVVLMVGVNGSGKTTTIGKLAAQWRTEGRKVVLAAGDTFRAAAIEQLKVWGQRTGAHVIAREQGADAAGVAHDALTEARAAGADILMIDTAGRLQNRAELMAELEKVVRVIRKLEPTAPHAVLLVLDATVGQNALSQVEAFTRIAGVTGLVMTKLDGTARGGILVAIAAKHKLPVHLIGVGESADDLQPFAARDFARAIAGLD